MPLPKSGRERNRRGFTLVELLVVIGIIALLLGILLPAMNKARAASRTIKCAAHLRSVGQGMQIYLADSKGTYPPAYLYEGHMIANGTQNPSSPNAGYIHWSSYIYGAGKIAADSFTCPELENGGLPATNPDPAHKDDEQQPDAGGGVIDQQAPRMAFTVNEAICPRNKFVPGFQGSPGYYRLVKGGQIKKSSEVILGTEFWDDWRIVSEAGYGGGDSVCKSHRPVHGFRGLGGELDMNKMAPNTRGLPAITNVIHTEVNKDVRAGQSSQSRLDWVGRNHGSGVKETRKSNFLYVDGHVETKLIEETLRPKFEWGEYFYSLVGGDAVAHRPTL